jgi:hypothetical protein
VLHYGIIALHNHDLTKENTLWNYLHKLYQS